MAKTKWFRAAPNPKPRPLAIHRENLELLTHEISGIRECAQLRIIGDKTVTGLCWGA
jgi:hypothetical protein